MRRHHCWPSSMEFAQRDRSWKDGRCRRYFISLEISVPIFLLSAFINTTFICHVFGVPFMISPRKLLAACLGCIERAEHETRSSSVEIDLGSRRVRHA